MGLIKGEWKEVQTIHWFLPSNRRWAIFRKSHDLEKCVGWSWMVCAIFDLRLLCQIICRIDWNFHLSCCQKCCKVCCVRWNHDEGKKPPYTSHTPGRNCPVNKGSATFVQIHSFMPWIGRPKTFLWNHTLVLCPTPVALDCPSCARDNYGNWL